MLQKKEQETISISRPNFETIKVKIRGNTPYCQNKFSEKAKQQMKETQEAGAKGKSQKKRVATDFNQMYLDAMYLSKDEWCGIPASAFRNAMISACKLVGVVMTRSKLALFVEPDGFDKHDSTPLVKITKGKPHYWEATVRLASGVCDIHPRPKWDEGWEAILSIRYDADMLGAEDVANLLFRAGAQVGVGEGRHDSKKSNGIGFGEFTIIEENAK